MKTIQKVKKYKNFDKLISLTFEVTYACDKNCFYCCQPKTKTDTKVINDIWKIILKIDMPLHLIIIGGEPTLIPESIDYFNEYYLKYKETDDKFCTYFTHGNSKNYDKFISTNNNKKFTISINYHYEETDYDLFMENIKLLRNKKINVAVCLLWYDAITDENIQKMKNVLITAKSLGCETHVEFEFDYSKNSFNENIKKYPEIMELRKKCYKYGSIEISNKSKTINYTSRDEFLNKVKYISNLPKICSNQFFYISPDGKIKYDCDFVNEKNVFEIDINKYLRSDVYCTSTCVGYSSACNDKIFALKNEKSYIISKEEK